MDKTTYIFKTPASSAYSDLLSNQNPEMQGLTIKH